jgi:hypothetical protein
MLWSSDIKINYSVSKSKSEMLKTPNPEKLYLLYIYSAIVVLAIYGVSSDQSGVNKKQKQKQFQMCDLYIECVLPTLM